LQLALDLLAQLRQLAEDVQGPLCVVCLGKALELRPGRLEPRQKLLGPGEWLVDAHVTRSRTMRPRMPFTSRAASSVA
jgi:hypothetical protein